MTKETRAIRFRLTGAKLFRAESGTKWGRRLWLADGAHLLLQIRTRVLNDQLAGDFRRWYPGFSQAPDPMTLAA